MKKWKTILALILMGFAIYFDWGWFILLIQWKCFFMVLLGSFGICRELKGWKIN